MMLIPSIWFSFVAFVVATMCNGFLSVNLEPKVQLQTGFFFEQTGSVDPDRVADLDPTIKYKIF